MATKSPCATTFKETTANLAQQVASQLLDAAPIDASTQTLFLPWEDSRIVANAELDTTVTLDWLYDDETHTVADATRSTCACPNTLKTPPSSPLCSVI